MPNNNNNRIIVLLFVLLVWLNANSQQHPFIWVTQSERAAILEKIETQKWAKSVYEDFNNRLNKDFKVYLEDPRSYLLELPFDRRNAVEGQTPPLSTIDYSDRESRSYGDVYMRFLHVGIDCGVMYYLTEDSRYAQCATDILNAFIKGLIQITPSDNLGNGGWLYPDDHLREAREIGAQIPIIYDFIHPFLKNGGKPYDLGENTTIDFPFEDAQQVFRTYAQLALDHGMTGSNWSILEAPSMIQNTLALEDKVEREKFLEYFLSIGSDRQDPLSVVLAEFKKEGDVYPETSQYSSGVASRITYIMAMLSKYDSSLNLAKKYPNVPLALSRWEALKYPNNEIVRFGDGHRYGGTELKSCEMAYYLGKIEHLDYLVKTFGTIIHTAISEGKYQREELGRRSFSANHYSDPIKLLWFCDSIEGKIVKHIPPRTDDMPHASVFLQRNLSATGKSEDGLMCFVGGAHMVHGHASGMDIELYGKGQVLGVDNGRGAYRKDLHENYSRIFAAHNSVIVNGSSQGEGGWAQLGMNPVKLISMEPMPREEAVSPYHSFSQTSFLDDKGDKAEAIQERTLAIIRTSPTTGYYVDVFRSKSKLPNEFHDYLYHNIGDELTFENDDLKLTSTPDRFMANANDEWVNNRKARNPGWHFFKDVQSSATYNKDVTAIFHTEKLAGDKIFMALHIPGFNNREYTKVKAPNTFEAPDPYESMPTPTLVIRKKGEAWKEPFVLVYEPCSGDMNNQSIQSVEKINQNGIYKGLKVKSNLGNAKITQFVLTQSKGETFTDNENEIEFTGSFAVITLDQKEELISIYVGEGEQLNFRNINITSRQMKDDHVFIDYTIK